MDISQALRLPLPEPDLADADSATSPNSASGSSSMKGYSQKNYHIGDGTLYSVMIPHQNKLPTRTYRGSTPGRGRGRGRGCRGGYSSRAGRALRFHQSGPSLEVEEARPRGLTPDVLHAAARRSSRAVRPETLSRVASVIAANCRREGASPPPPPPPRRGRPRGRGRGSRAIPGFIQEVHGNMARLRQRILVEKTSFDGDSARPATTSSRLVRPPTPPPAAAACSYTTAAASVLHSLLSLGMYKRATASASSQPGDAPSAAAEDVQPLNLCVRDSRRPAELDASPQPSRRKRRRPLRLPPPARTSSDINICRFKFRGGANPSLQQRASFSLSADVPLNFYQTDLSRP